MKLLRLNLSKNERQSIKIINNFLTVVQIIKKMFKTAQITQKKKKKPTTQYTFIKFQAYHFVIVHY